MGWGGAISELNAISLLFIRLLTLWEANFNYHGLTKPKYSSMFLFSCFLTTVSLQHTELCLKFVSYVKWWGKGSSEFNHLALLFKTFSPRSVHFFLHCRKFVDVWVLLKLLDLFIWNWWWSWAMQILFLCDEYWICFSMWHPAKEKDIVIPCLRERTGRGLMIVKEMI